MALVAVRGGDTFHIGDIVRVHQKIQEEGKTRVQIFEGMAIAIRGEGENKSFTVRRIGTGRIGIERIFPLFSPLIERIEVKAKGSVRRAKLYYLRKKTSHEVAEITKKHHRMGKQSKSKFKTKSKKLKTKD